MADESSWFDADEEWVEFESLSPTEVARQWLAATRSRSVDGVVQYGYDICHLKGMAYYTEWLAALINFAEGDVEIGSVGAGPVEASLARNLPLARAVDSLVSRPRLQAVLRTMWFDDAVPEVRKWARQILDDGSPHDAGLSYPRGLID